MKNIFILISCLLIGINSYAQKSYVSISASAFFATSVKDPINLLSSTIEYGRYLKSGISLGISYGYFSLDADQKYSLARITCPILEKNDGVYNLSLSGGVGWFYKFKDILFEYDINNSFKISDKNSLVLSYCVNSAFGDGNMKSFVFAFNRDF